MGTPRNALVVLLAALLLAGCGSGAGTDTGGEPSTVAEQAAGSSALTYPVVDTGQVKCYDDTGEVNAPAAGQAFYGQDAQHAGNRPSYTRSADGLTVEDGVTGLTWQSSPDVDGDGALGAADKLTWDQAQALPGSLNAAAYGGYADWRLPTIKELYSLIDFSGTDPSGMNVSTSGLKPFIDTDYFEFAYGDVTGERVIDSQYASCTRYAADPDKLFGVNFADGRIKGYDLSMPGGRSKTFFVLCVRGNTGYGTNSFRDNGDGTVSDAATGLTWSQADSGLGLDWQEALAWVQQKNSEGYLGHDDWRLPSAKELQSIVDYTRSPDTTASAAIDPVFSCTTITNEAGQADYPFYWSSTTHANSNGSGSAAAYVAFGRALGYMNGRWVDVHGAGAQRSDPKVGDPAGYPQGRGPQGDAVRAYDYVRLVRDADTDTAVEAVESTTGVAWRFAVVGDTQGNGGGVNQGVTAAIVRSILQEDVDLVLVPGDLVTAGRRCSETQLHAQLETWLDVFAPLFERGIGVWPVRGNHEADASGSIAAWEEVFGADRFDYTFTHKNAAFIGLDEYAPGQEHLVDQDWLDEQLAGVTAPHLFVFGHDPAFQVNHQDCLGRHPAERNAFWGSLEAAGAGAYFCGHDHFFDLALVEGGGSAGGNDLYQCVVGTGGGDLFPRHGYAGDNAPYVPAAVCHEASHGYLLVEVSGEGPDGLGVTMTWKESSSDAEGPSLSYETVRPALTSCACP